MKIVIAMDSFKGSLSSLEAGEAVAEGIRAAEPEALLQVRPLADGGEGTVEALTAGLGGRLEQAEVCGPLGRPVRCSYGILRDGQTAVIEMAAAAGLPLVPEKERNPLYTTTFGVGQVIRRAIEQGCRRFLVGLGGSATNDGGAGMLQALGFRLLNRKGREIPRGAAGLRELAEIRTEGVLKELSDCTFRAACDVVSVLCGHQGCSAVFAPQKGADQEMILEMDRWLQRYADVVRKRFPEADPEEPGAGAAGGMGFAFSACLGARLEPGVKIILEETGMEECLREAELVFTGEGRMDGQTAMGKAPAGLAALAGKYGKTVVALTGSVAGDTAACHRAGIHAVFPVLRSIQTLEEAMDRENAFRNVRDTAEQVYRFWRAAKGGGKAPDGKNIVDCQS